MYHRFNRFLALVTLSLVVTACVTAPKALDPGHFAVAKRFLHNIEAGKWALLSIQRKIDEEAKEQPGMAVLNRRVFADLTEDEIEIMISDIYARHVAQEHLAEMARFTDSPTGKKFFRIGFVRAFNDAPRDVKEAMRQFNADELTEIIKFSQSDAAAELERQLPTINQEVFAAAHKMGEDRMKEYINKL